MKRTILVTGASGFIGTALVRHLRACKAGRVLGVDLKKAVKKDPLSFRLDLLDEAAVKRFLQRHKPQVIFHLAGGRFADPEVMFAANVMTTYVLLKAVVALRDHHPRVVVVGSAAEYGVVARGRLLSEDMQGKVEGTYGRCKAFQTSVALHFVPRGADVVVARLFNILGPGIPEASVVGKFAADIVGMERSREVKELCTGNLSAVRDFLDIRDICSALFCLAGKGRSGEIYNICSQKGVPIRKLLAQMNLLSSREKIVVCEDRKKDPGVLRAVGSCAKLMKATGWRPRYSFQRSAADTLAYYRATKGNL